MPSRSWARRRCRIPTPHPLLVFWAYDHPPISDRLRFAVTYRPWDAGQANRYIK